MPLHGNHAAKQSRTEVYIKLATQVANLPESCGACSGFYQEFVVMTPAAATILEQETRSQSTPLWHSSRQLRLTASTAKQVPVLSKTSCEKLVASLVCPIFAGNASTCHDHRYEPVARAQLSHDYHLAVTRCGTFVCNDLPWISASPDGMIDELDAILEIKCLNTDDCLSTPAKYDLKHQTGNEYELVEKGSKKFYMQLMTCGFRINPDDSEFIPTQRIRFLGFLLDGNTQTIGHTPARCRDLLATLKILKVPRTVPTYQRLAGLWSFYFSLYQAHFHAIRPLRHAAATGIPPSREWVELFSFVLSMLPASVPFVPPTVQHTAFSDASLTGLGICSTKGNIAVICPTPFGIYKREL
ncbi:hypothetical protein ISCGN_008105 [Ixodes scapularis]